MTISFTVEDSIAGLRGDHVIRARHPDVDREFALKLLKGGRIRIAGAVATLKTMTAAGDTVTVDIAEGRLGPALSPRFVVLREDRGLIVLDKADGVAMHSGQNIGEMGDSDDVDDDDLPLTDALRERFEVEEGFNGPSFPGRLDRPTSGLVLAAMTEAALRDVEPAWRAGMIKKEYLVVCYGKTAPQGMIDIPLAGRRSHQRGTGVVEEAKTAFTTVARGGGISLVVAELLTGRTHQIRRHFNAVGHPLVGDKRHGGKDDTVDEGLMLHAWRLRKGPVESGEVVAWPERLPTKITAPWPDRIRRELLKAGIDIAAAEKKAKAIGALAARPFEDTADGATTSAAAAASAKVPTKLPNRKPDPRPQAEAPALPLPRTKGAMKRAVAVAKGEAADAAATARTEKKAKSITKPKTAPKVKKR